MDFSQIESTTSNPNRIPPTAVPQLQRSLTQRRVPEELRLALEDLQRVAENAITSAVNTDLNLAIKQTVRTIDDFTQAKQQDAQQQLNAQSESFPAVTFAPALGDSDPHCVLTFAPAPWSGRRWIAAAWNDTRAIRGRAQETLLRFFEAFASWRRNLVHADFGHASSLSGRTISIVSILLFAGTLLVISSHAVRMGRAAVPGNALVGTTHHADPEDTPDAQVLTVLIKPDQTLKELSLLYVGHYDSDMFAQIRALNPELQGQNRIEAGQLLRLPLPHATLKKVMDTAETASASKASSEGLLYRLRRLWNRKH